jgi:DNA-binding NtrC family response regulator
VSLAESRDPAGSQSWLVVAPGTAQERKVEVGAQPVLIGKDEAAQLRLDDPHVSRQHALVEVGSEGVVLRDLGSRNGTVVNGIPIKEVLLQHGAEIRVGLTDILYTTDTGALHERLVASPRRAVPPRPGANGARRADGFAGAVGASPAMQRVFELLEKLAPADLSITLLGETGVGKDVLARAIHAASPRASGPFVVFDCGAVAPNLIESELFGHERGSFTGAVTDRQGAFERAHTGTLFLDEVAELPLDLQPRLLRVLEERAVRRVGGDRSRPVDVRVVAATNRELEAEVKAGTFRQDLFFRLNAAVVHVPPLRDRLEDLPALVQAALQELGVQARLADDTVAALRAYDWPGNVRELKNVVTSAAAFVDGPVLEPRHLMFFKKRGRAQTLDNLPLGGRSLEKIERAAIKQTLEHAGGNKTRAARTLGIAPSTLYEKIKKYEL